MAERVSSAGGAQAVFLGVLAGHLQRWDLVPVNVSSDHAGGWQLQVFSERTRCARTGVRLPHDVSVGLIGWARSFGVAELVVQPLPKQVNVEFLATLGGCRVVVWGCVDPLREAMGLTELDTTITTAELAQFAGHGTGAQLPDSAGGGEPR